METLNSYESRFLSKPIFLDPGKMFGVDSTSSAWYVINAKTLIGKRIGPRTPATLTKALKEADRLNLIVQKGTHK